MEKTYQELCAEIEILKQQAESVRAKEISNAIVEVKRLIKEYGLTANDCGFSAAKSASSSKKLKAVPVKYRHPDNAALTWTGRGKLPKWLAEMEAQGQQRERFLV